MRSVFLSLAAFFALTLPLSAKNCVLFQPYLGADGSYYALCWTEVGPYQLAQSVIDHTPEVPCDVDGAGPGDQDGEPPICEEEPPAPDPAICDSDSTTDAPACRLPAGCNDGSDGRDGGAMCYCTTDDKSDPLADCPFGT